MYATVPLIFGLLSGTALSTPLLKSSSLDARDADPLKIEVEVTPSGSDGMTFNVPDFSEIIQDLKIPGFGDATQEETIEGFDGLVEPGVALPSASAVAIPIPSEAARVLPLNTSLTPNITAPANNTFNATHSLLPNASLIPLASLTPSNLPSSIAEALQGELANLDDQPKSKTKRKPSPAAHADAEANVLTEKIKTATSKIPIPGMGNVAEGAAGACNTSNTQVNQCSSGIPYCCSPDGAGGQTCMDSTVNCKQTIICCNNFNGFQFCMGDIDFNIPITINMNLGRDKKRSV